MTAEPGQRPKGRTVSWDHLRESNRPTASRRRVLILGCSPLPFENQRMNLAPGARTWQFGRACSEDGHAVSVVAMRIPGTYGDGCDEVDHFERDGVRCTTLSYELFRQSGIVEGAVEAFQPDVIIGASSTVPALRAIEVAAGRPVWVDLFGDLMAEAQARLGVHPDEDLAAYRDVLLRLLEAGDAFSTVSSRQRWAVVGQLGLVGRLNRRTLGHTSVHTMPCCLWDAGSDEAIETPAEILLGIGDDDVVLLWSGGFNTWCDMDTLIVGVESAMAANPRIRFVATGGSIPGHDDSTFVRFRERVSHSAHADRFVILGGVEARHATAIRQRADLGIVTEKELAERSLGSSGRILHWLECGLGFVCTDLSELGETLAEHDLASIYRAADPGDLSRAILEVVSDPDAVRERAARARQFAVQRWSVEATTVELRRWVECGGVAPDVADSNPLSLVEATAAQRALSETQAELEAERVRYHDLRSELGRIHESRMWKLWMAYLGLGGRFRSSRNPASERERDDR